MFALEFHLPHYVLRTDVRFLQEDMRLWNDDTQFRSFRDVTHLRGDCRFSDVIYQSVTSCLVTGPSSQRWTAYMFTDTYFIDQKNRHLNEESIMRWTKERRGFDSSDPFSLGVDLASKPLVNARDYFIDIFAKRLERSYHEWNHIVSHFDSSVGNYVR